MSNPRRHEFEYRSESCLSAPLDNVFAFFADPRNLNHITPSSLAFRILTPESELVMRKGLRIDYALRIKRIPIRWQSLISEYDPPFLFVDEQIRGPYKRWRHTHEFEADGECTIVRDVVAYVPPGGPFAPLLNNLVVRRDIQKIFSYRSQVLQDIFPSNGREVHV